MNALRIVAVICVVALVTIGGSPWAWGQSYLGPLSGDYLLGDTGQSFGSPRVVVFQVGNHFSVLTNNTCPNGGTRDFYLDGDITFAQPNVFHDATLAGFMDRCTDIVLVGGNCKHPPTYSLMAFTATIKTQNQGLQQTQIEGKYQMEVWDPVKCEMVKNKKKPHKFTLVRYGPAPSTAAPPPPLLRNPNLNPAADAFLKLNNLSDVLSK